MNQGNSYAWTPSLGTGEEYTAVLLVRTPSATLDTVATVTFVP